jgi:phospholipid transport system substrate-binding protein
MARSGHPWSIANELPFDCAGFGGPSGKKDPTESSGSKGTPYIFIDSNENYATLKRNWSITRMNLKRISILTFLMVLWSCALANAGEPTEAIRGALNQGVEILKNAKLDNQKQRSQVIDRLRQIVYPLFDFREIAMRSLGAHWRRINAQQREEFVSIFTRLLEKTYADQIDLYNGQQVVYTGESVDGDFAQVDSRIIDKNAQTYSVAYRLHRVDGKWRIYDVVAENISVVNNYRSQFDRVIARSSFDELLKIMKQKAS